MKAGAYVYWSNPSGIGVGRIVKLDALRFRALVQPDFCNFRAWVSTAGLRLFPELGLPAKV